MPFIITVTDFSDIADKAVNYSCRLAADVGASVVVLHSFEMPVTLNDTPMPVLPVNDEMEVAEGSMADLMQRLKLSHAGVDVSGKVIYGDVIDGIGAYTENEQPWLIIFGNSDAGDTTSWFGSAVVNMLRNLPYPVLAIPPDATYKPVKKICFACDYKYDIAHAAGHIINLAARLRAEVHILNISSGDGQANEIAGEKNINGPITHLSSVQPQYHFVAGAKVDEGIQKFVLDNNMDWLLIMPRKHSFFEGLFHKSHTEAMVQMSHIPIAALHCK